MFVLGLACVALVVAVRAGDALDLVQTIPLPGVRGRFDHFALDAKGRRLFVAALGNDTLEVIDLTAGRRLKSLTGLHEPQGVAFLPGPNRIMVANGGDGTVRSFDGATYEPLKSVGSLPDADNLRFDAARSLVYVGYGDGALGVIDPATMQVTGRIKLDAHPESFQLEPREHRLWVNVPNARQIVVIDRERKAVTVTWPMEQARANFPMALDEAARRLFIGCRQPARLVVLDLDTGRFVTDLEIVGDLDDLFFDAARHRLYASGGEGFVDVVAQRDPDHYERLVRVPTRAGARTSFYAADLDAFYLAVPARDGREAEVRVFRPK